MISLIIIMYNHNIPWYINIIQYIYIYIYIYKPTRIMEWQRALAALAALGVLELPPGQLSGLALSAATLQHEMPVFWQQAKSPWIPGG
jgi:hypothetical protein